MSVLDYLWRGRTPRLTDGESLGAPEVLPPAAAAAPGPSEERSIRSIETYQVYELNRPVRTTWSTSKAIDEGLKASSWVYFCACLIAESASSVPWIAEVRSGRGTAPWKRAEGHPLEELIESPNAAWDRAEYLQRLILHLLLGGNALTTKVRDGAGVPGELWLIAPDKIKPVPGGDYIVGYERTGGPQRGQRLAVEDVIHGQLVDPSNPFWGLSRLQAGARAVDSDVAAADWNFNQLKRSINPSGMLVHKGPISKDQFEMSKAQIAEKRGHTMAGEVLIFGSDAEFRPFDRSPRDMDWTSGRKLSRDEIAILFNVPLPLVTQEASTYNNVLLARRRFWRDNVRPLLHAIAGWLNRGLAPDFGDGVRCRPDLSEVDELSRFTEENLAAMAQLWDRGVPMSQINRMLRLGLEPYPGWDQSYLPANRVPADGVDPGGNGGL